MSYLAIATKKHLSTSKPERIYSFLKRVTSNIRPFKYLDVRLVSQSSFLIANCSKLFIGRLHLHDKQCFSTLDNPQSQNITENNDTKDECYGANEKSDDQTGWGDKLIFSTYLEKYRPPRSWKWEMSEKWRKPIRDAERTVNSYESVTPIALKYIDDTLKYNSEDDLTEDIDSFNTSEKPQFPYGIHVQSDFDVEKADTESFSSSKGKHKTDPVENNAEEENLDWHRTYDVPNPDIPASSIPCGGCGAYLHCQDAAIPGYMPPSTFCAFDGNQLMGEICQRCYFLKNHNAALSINVSPDMYPKILSQIKKEFALVLLVIDLLDFPCSIWPNIIDIIGEKRPVILVGNKVDLLPRDSVKYLQHIQLCLEQATRDAGLDRARIIGTSLISATTGFGIEELITKIHNFWGYKGHIFIMGCTNVGKSSLFNSFLQSDMCKIQVVDLVHRATVSPWPGTTLNLLKFPIMRPDGNRLYMRYERLKKERQQIASEEDIKMMQLKKTRDPVHATLMGRVGRTFLNMDKAIAIQSQERLNSAQDIFQVNPLSKALSSPVQKIGNWDPHHPALEGKWCYDTPGVVNENQILDLLTLPELMKVLPKELIEPRSYYIKVGTTLFIGGLARIDYVDGQTPIRYTVFTSKFIPITICLTSDAEVVYKNAMGTPIFGVPLGDNERLGKFPQLKSTEYSVEGIGNNESVADIVISSTGFVAVTVAFGKTCRLTVHSPNGTGLVCRQPSLLPYTIKKKGKRIRDTPAYAHHRVFVPP